MEQIRKIEGGGGGRTNFLVSIDHGQVDVVKIFNLILRESQN